MVTSGFDWKQKEACLIEKEGECFIHNPEEQKLLQCRTVSTAVLYFAVG